MQHVTLGRTGLKVSRLCLGTMNFGPRTSPEESFAILDKGLELGIQFIDTADVYGHRKHEGYTEQILGDWFAQGGRRDRVVLATKCYGIMGDGPNDRGLSAFHIRRACDASLRRMKTDHIDLYQMHHVDRACPWEEIWQAMDQLISAGKVTYVGSSNFAGWHIAHANHKAQAFGTLGLVCEQSKYSLLCRTPELEVLPACKHYGVGVIPWSPLDGGMLGGGMADGSHAGVRRAAEGNQKRLEKLLPQIQRWEALCAKIGHPCADVALAWTLHHPAVTAPIIGPRTLSQLTDAARAVELKLDADTLKELDAIFPGPGGEAPEAYAW